MIKNLLSSFMILSVTFLSCAKQNPEEHFKKGTRLYAEEKYDEAIEEFQKAIEIDSTYLNAYVNLGAIYFKQGKYEQASIQYETVLRYQPYHIKAHYNLGLIRLEQGEVEKAKVHYEYLRSVRSSFAERLKAKIQKD